MSNPNDRLAGLSLEEKRALLARKLAEKATKERTLPLSYSQRRIWLVEQMTPGNSGLNIPLTARMRGSLNLDALKQAVDQIITRHDTLRTAFSAADGEPFQTIYPSVNFTLEVEDFSHLPDPQAEAERYTAEDAVKPFDIRQAPLMRAMVIVVGENDYFFHIVLHHIVADGWSLGVFIRELGALYSALVQHQAPGLPPLTWQYGDFVNWQRENFQGELVQKQIAFWRERLADSPPLLPLPIDHPRPAIQTYVGGHLTLTLPTSLTEALKQLSRDEGTTLYMTLLAAYSILLSRFTGLDDIPIGSPIAGRNRSEMEGLIGVFINNIVLRVSLADDPSFQELLQHVRTVALSAYEHQDVPFEMLIEELHPVRHLNHTPLFQVFFNMLNFRTAQFNLPGVKVEIPPAHDIGSNFDMTLYGIEHEQKIDFLLVYNADLYSRERMQSALEQYQYLLEQIVQKPEQAVSRYSLAPGTHSLPDVTAPLPAIQGENVVSRFSQNALRHPEQVAVVDSHGAWTYEELHIRSNQLAHYLREGGITDGRTVAIYADRSASLVWAMLGIAKAGAAFIILDPDYPAARLSSYLELAQPEGIIQLTSAKQMPDELRNHIAELKPRCQVELPPHFNQLQTSPLVNMPAETPDADIRPDTLAYIAFTSGSTGKPKGIVGTWGPLDHFLGWHAEHFGLNASDHFTMLSGLAHDPLLRDIFTPLWLGATLCVPNPASILQPGWVASWMQEQGITITHLTPAMGQIVSGLDTITIPTLRYAFFGGDILTIRDVVNLRALAENVTCVNFYGATETPQAMGYYIVPGEVNESQAAETVSIGQGIDGVQLLVLRPDLELAGVSEVGEIYVRTPYLTLGYLGDQAMTSERYVTSPATGDQADHWYRTGDLGRYRPDGVISYLGRKDQQIKIRGFRIELGDIEAALQQADGVEQALVIAREDTSGEKQLIAYVVTQDSSSLDTRVLRETLKASLPSYMLPSAIMPLDAFPLTPNGKIDRRALPDPHQGPVQERSIMGAQTPTEALLVELWRELLGVEAISVFDNFFDLGGHSLQAVRFVASVEEKTGQKLEPMILRFQTLKQLALTIDPTSGNIPSGDALAASENGAAPNHEMPLFFGSEHELFGMYYQPQNGSASDTAIVICPPWGQEYIRSHRACHQLALRLANLGIPALRFDYYGTGDSAGEDMDCTLSRSVADIALAVDELRARSGVKNVALVGLRLGAVLAALASTTDDNLSRVVLWDPIVNGSEYLDELNEWHRHNTWYYLGGVSQDADQQMNEVLGFGVSDTLFREIQQVNLLDIEWQRLGDVMLVEREPSEATHRLRLHLQSCGINDYYEQIDGPQIWTENTDKALVPHQTLQSIVNWIAKEAV